MKTSKVSYYELSALKTTGQVQEQMGKTIQERGISLTIMITLLGHSEIVQRKDSDTGVKL